MRLSLNWINFKGKMSSEYYIKNRAKILERVARYRRENKEKVAAMKRADLEKHREKRAAKQREWREANAEALREKKRLFFQENKSLIYEKRRADKTDESAVKNREYMRAYRAKNRDKITESSRKYVAKYPDRVRRSKAAHAQGSIKTKITRLLRRRTWLVIKRALGEKSDSTIALLGCTVGELIKHFESLFQPGMTWDNHGKNGWHIDHKTPCAAFDLTKEEEQRKCFHYTNLQPLWAFDNLSKGAKIKTQTDESRSTNPIQRH